MTLSWLDTLRRMARLTLRAPRRRLTMFGRAMPTGLYARSLLIIVMPVVILQAVIAYVFMERHWQLVTQRLSAAVSRDIAALVDIYETYPQDPAFLARISRERFEITADILPLEPFPPQVETSFFSLLDQALSEELALRLDRPFWIDTVGQSSWIEIRVRLDDAVLRVITRRSQAYASNSHIFLVWMVGASLVLLVVAILFLRNQIKPIVVLADAAERLGKGRSVPDFKPRGAREVRRASQAFLEMRDRIERQIEQRTTMLAGVSHDLRTVLTRFKLQLAFLGKGPEVDELTRDVDEMTRMLEDYLAFAQGASGEQAVEVQVTDILTEIETDAARHGCRITVSLTGDPAVILKPHAFKRCLANLVGNAVRFGRRVEVMALRRPGAFIVHVDDDGPGIPQEDLETVFRPFLRLDDARNQDHAGSGLGLAIARDIARSHGGDVTLTKSPLGGLRATVQIPA